MNEADKAHDLALLFLELNKFEIKDETELADLYKRVFKNIYEELTKTTNP